MTENEARQVIECIGEKLNDNSLVFYTKVEQKALDMAIQVLEEIQKYRELGTVELLIKSNAKALFEHMELEQYRAIGTVEEFKALKECVYVDERPFIFVCPNCEENYTLEQDERPSCCIKCNAKIDWNKVIFYQL